jgi:two-component system, OmpR family, response regulator
VTSPGPVVLVVEDEPQVLRFLRASLGAHGYHLIEATTGAAGMTEAAARNPDVILLDLGLPDVDGLEVTRRLREWTRTPIIVISARGQDEDKVKALDEGADDYLTKPFSPRELLARIRTILRRRRAEVHQGKPEGIRAYRFDGWELNLNTRRLVSPAGKAVALSNGEFSLLVVLLGAPSRILSRDQLLDLSRLHNDEVYNRSVDVQIMRLRRKIETDPAEPRYIRTERGAGYVFGVPVETVY